ncbi:MAG TPA: hypothetical protein VGO11_16240 [Chthoniobacteraceae bacterium]|nr:hypothetical protein [Chthoniobacteraceae bacterium]
MRSLIVYAGIAIITTGCGEMALMRDIRRLDTAHARGQMSDAEYNAQKAVAEQRLAVYSAEVTRIMAEASSPAGSYSDGGSGTYVQTGNRGQSRGAQPPASSGSRYVQYPVSRPRDPAPEQTASSHYVTAAARPPGDPHPETYSSMRYVPSTSAPPNAARPEAPSSSHYVQNVSAPPGNPHPEQAARSTYVQQGPAPAPPPKVGGNHAPTYVANKKSGFALPPGKITSANWEYAKKEIAKHEELKGKLGPIGWLWTGAEYIAVNAIGEEIGGFALGEAPKNYVGKFMFGKAASALWDAATESRAKPERK